MSRSYAFAYDQGMARTVVGRQPKPGTHGRTTAPTGASNTTGTAVVPVGRLPMAVQLAELAKTAERTVVVSVELTVSEAEALRDGAFTCTSPDPRRHQAGRRALRALREALRGASI
jgi:hypothetical protein